MASLSIHVHGTAYVARRAERAVVYVDVSESGPVQSDVIGNVSRTASQLQEGLKQLSSKKENAPEPPVSKWTMASISTGSYLIIHSEKSLLERRERVYSASTRFEITFSDFAKLGAAATDLASIPLVSIRSITWTLTEATRISLQGEIRKKAVEDAVTKARDFAAAVGKHTVIPREITSNSSHAPSYGGATLFGGTSSGLFGGPARKPDTPDLNFEPEEIRMNCDVQMKFEAQ